MLAHHHCFTLGSTSAGCRQLLFRECAAKRLGYRAVLLTGRSWQRAAAYCENIVAFDYAPTPVFGRSAVIVHQGGISTTAQH